jgi:hypothetical protein
MKQPEVMELKMLQGFNGEYYGRLMAALQDEGALEKGAKSSKSTPD